MTQSNIRNFAIIAHIDHGKSTLADRLMEMTGTVEMRDMKEQLLDSNPIERERGITIKLAPVRMIYQMTENRGQKTENKNPSSAFCPPSSYVLNLIDTPGHVDFTYEVSRSLAACEGALLVVDASQGVQAQTLANLHLARNHNLKVIPLINKIDLPNARIEETRREIIDLGFTDEEIIEISAKTGKNVRQVLEAIVERIHAPNGSTSSPLRALVFSSQYDPHKGVVVFVRVVDGSIGGRNSVCAEVANENLSSSAGPVAGFLPRIPTRGPLRGSPSTRATRSSLFQNSIRFLQSGSEVTPIEVGYFMPSMMPSDGLSTGEVGYIATGLKDVRMAKVGDTITLEKTEDRKQKAENRKQKTENNGALSAHCSLSHDIQPLPGYREPKPMVFVGLFPIEQDEFTKSRVAMEKLRLSDSAFSFRPISSQALGNGFHCGFLGLLHAEIVQERLSREFGLSLLATAPSVEYQVKLKAGVNPSKAGLVHGGQLLEQKTENTRLPARQGKQKTENPSSAIRFPSSVFSITSPSEFPDPTYIEEVEEPMMKLTIYSPKRYVGAIMQFVQKKRGEYVDMKYLYQKTQITQTTSESEHQTFRLSDSPNLRNSESSEFSDCVMVEMQYLIPLSDMIVDFFDTLKSVTEGYASLDYEFFEYQKADVIKVDILANHEKVDALSFLVVRDQARFRGKDIVERLAEVLPRQQFNIPVQAAIGGEIVARADIKPYRKDVIAKLYGGDRTRKDKLLKKQKKGKEKMKRVGSVEIPQDAFFTVLRNRKS